LRLRCRSRIEAILRYTPARDIDGDLPPPRLPPRHATPRYASAAHTISPLLARACSYATFRRHTICAAVFIIMDASMPPSRSDAAAEFWRERRREIASLTLDAAILPPSLDIGLRHAF